MLVSMQRSTAAFTAVADGIEAPQHGIFEKGMVDVTALVFGTQDIDGFCWGDPPRATRMMLLHEAGKWIANDQAYVQRQAWIGAR